MMSYFLNSLGLPSKLQMSLSEIISSPFRAKETIQKKHSKCFAMTLFFLFLLCHFLFSAYLSPGCGDPLQLLVPGAAPQDTCLLGFRSVVLPAHAVGHHHRFGPRISAATEHTPLPQATAAGFGALRVDKKEADEVIAERMSKTQQLLRTLVMH